METNNIDQAQLEPIQLEFRGNAGEYFRIWIVNTLLAIVTLGIYSAWGKVRNRKYMYGNTYLQDSSFDYHADPVKILKGRLVIGAIFGLYTLGGYVSPILSGMGGLLFAVLYPWIVVRGNIFNLTNTTYRNIKFNFNHAYKEAYMKYGKAFLISLITFGIAAPYFYYTHANFKLNNSFFGKTGFSFKGQYQEFFKIIYTAGLGYIVAVLFFVFAPVMIGYLQIGGDSAIMKGVMGAIMFIGIYASIFVMTAFIKAKMNNYVLGNTRLGNIELRSKLDWFELGVIYVTNFIVIAITFGLATPWALVRVHKYRLSRTYLKAPVGEADNFIAAQVTETGHVAEAAVDFWDVDLGF